MYWIGPPNMAAKNFILEHQMLDPVSIRDQWLDGVSYRRGIPSMHLRVYSTLRKAISSGDIPSVNWRLFRTVEEYHKYVRGFAILWEIPPVMISNVECHQYWGMGKYHQYCGKVDLVYPPIIHATKCFCVYELLMISVAGVYSSDVLWCKLE